MKCPTCSNALWDVCAVNGCTYSYCLRCGTLCRRDESGHPDAGTEVTVPWLVAIHQVPPPDSAPPALTQRSPAPPHGWGEDAADMVGR